MLELLVVFIDGKPQHWNSAYSVLLTCGHSPTIFCTEQEARTAIDLTVASAIKHGYDEWAIVSGGKVTIHKLISSEVCTVTLDMESVRLKNEADCNTTKHHFLDWPSRKLRCLLRK